jgi:hypothetical protein
MQQGTGFDEDQRRLAGDDVATLAYAASGLDELSGTADDYRIRLIYGGISAVGCDLNLSFNNAQTGFAVCQTGGALIAGSSDHVVITSANAFFNTGFAWHFNQVLDRNAFFFGDFEIGNFSLWQLSVP